LKAEIEPLEINNEKIKAIREELDGCSKAFHKKVEEYNASNRS